MRLYVHSCTGAACQQPLASRSQICSPMLASIFESTTVTKTISTPGVTLVFGPLVLLDIQRSWLRVHFSCLGLRALGTWSRGFCSGFLREASGGYYTRFAYFTSTLSGDWHSVLCVAVGLQPRPPRPEVFAKKVMHAANRAFWHVLVVRHDRKGENTAQVVVTAFACLLGRVLLRLLLLVRRRRGPLPRLFLLLLLLLLLPPLLLLYHYNYDNYYHYSNYYYHHYYADEDEYYHQRYNH